MTQGKQELYVAKEHFLFILRCELNDNYWHDVDLGIRGFTNVEGMLLSLSVCILYIVDILIICIAVYLTTPELRGALKSNYHLLARKYTICARLVGYGSSVQRQS